MLGMLICICWARRRCCAECILLDMCTICCAWRHYAAMYTLNIWKYVARDDDMCARRRYVCATICVRDDMCARRYVCATTLCARRYVCATICVRVTICVRDDMCARAPSQKSTICFKTHILPNWLDHIGSEQVTVFETCDPVVWNMWSRRLKHVIPRFPTCSRGFWYV